MQAQGASKLQCYTSEQIECAWPWIEPHIRRGLERQTDYCAEDIKEGLLNKSMQVWCWQSWNTIHAAMVTTIQNDAETKWCLLLCIGGDSMDEWKTRLPIVEEWAKENGCTEMRIYGRIGWARVLGYDVEYTKLKKVI